MVVLFLLVIFIVSFYIRASIPHPPSFPFTFSSVNSNTPPSHPPAFGIFALADKRRGKRAWFEIGLTHISEETRRNENENEELFADRMMGSIDSGLIMVRPRQWVMCCMGNAWSTSRAGEHFFRTKKRFDSRVHGETERPAGKVDRNSEEVKEYMVDCGYV